MAVQFSTANDAALGRIMARLKVIADPSPHIPSLMLSWQQVITDDNREGVLAGLDRYGQPMVPVTYRPIDPRTDIRSKSSEDLRHGQRPNRKRDLLFRGLGPGSGRILANNNLSSSEYRKLDGPPLAPRYQFSRVISNLKTDWMRDSTHPMRFIAYGAWDEVVSETGYEFLPVHFQGLPLGKHGPSIQRDLRGVRPDGMIRAREILRNWLTDLMVSYGMTG